jgi:hypothetical protein
MPTLEPPIFGNSEYELALYIYQKDELSFLKNKTA